MNKAEKIEFIETLLQTIKNKAVSEIENNCVPEIWDGIELRWYLSELVENATLSKKAYRIRYSNFKNDVIIHDL